MIICQGEALENRQVLPGRKKKNVFHLKHVYIQIHKGHLSRVPRWAAGNRVNEVTCVFCRRLIDHKLPRRRIHMEGLEMKGAESRVWYE